MTMKRIFALLFLIAGTAQAQNAPFSLEAGYRWLDLKGNPGMYKTQINEREGFVLRSFTMTNATIDDRFSITVSDFGNTPAGSLRIDADKRDLYRFRLGYRTADQYSIFLSQHFTNKTRRMLDVDLDLLPEQHISPFIGYSFNRFGGPGETTYHFGQDEFLLRQKQKDVENEVRAGATFTYDKVYGSFTQGWRRAHSTIDSSLFPGAGEGNNSGPILGQPINATSIARHDTERASTPFTDFYVTVQPMQRIRLIGNYNRFAAKSNGNESEADYGSFASFAISRFFTGFTETAESHAKNTSWGGGGRAEVTIVNGVDLLAGIQRQHRDMNGSALLDTLYLQSITFGGVDQRDFHDVLNADSSITRTEDVANFGISARNLGPFAVRAELRKTKQDVNVNPDLSEIVVPGSQSGKFDRNINTFDMNGQYTSNFGLTLGAAWKRENADRPIFRTDFDHRHRYRFRALYAAPKWFRIGTVWEKTRLSNDNTFSGTIRNYTTDAAVVPNDIFSLHGSISSFRSDSSMLIRRPETMTTTPSVHMENGHSREGGFSVTLPKVTFDTNITRFQNNGTYPFQMNRYTGRATFPLKGRYGVAVEYNKDKYDESTPLDYDATRWGLFLRIQ